MKIYHGTSKENFESILKNGFNPENPVWNASESDFIYFWNPRDLMKLNDLETLEEGVNDAIRNAFYSAQITAALQKSKETEIIVIEIDVPKKYIKKDDSCPNMDGAVKVNTDNLSVENITAVYAADFLYNMSLLYLVGVIDNDLSNIYDFLTTAEIEFIQSVKKSGFYMDSPWDIDWYPYENF